MDMFYFFAHPLEVVPEGTKYGGGQIHVIRTPRPVKTPRDDVMARLERLREEGRKVREMREARRQTGEESGRYGGGVGGERFAERQMLQERLDEKVMLGKITKSEIPYFLELFTSADVIGEMAKTKGERRVFWLLSPLSRGGPRPQCPV